MATETPTMPLATARHYAEQIRFWLEIYIERAEIAGSIRRERPMCGDVDIVCIPKLEEYKTGLFAGDNQVVNTLRTYLVHYVQRGGNDPKSRSKPKWSNDTEPQLDAKNLLLQLPKCQLDLWCATPQNFASLLLCRTGSKEHNIWLASRAQALGLKWKPYEGLYRAGVLVPTATEEEIYAALNLPFVRPQDRELPVLLNKFGPAENV